MTEEVISFSYPLKKKKYMGIYDMPKYPSIRLVDGNDFIDLRAVKPTPPPMPKIDDSAETKKKFWNFFWA